MTRGQQREQARAKNQAKLAKQKGGDKGNKLPSFEQFK